MRVFFPTEFIFRNAQAADSAQEAIVFFETSAAARTALLLTNALIVDRAITVVPYTASAEAPKGGPEQVTVQAADIEQKNYPVPDSERVLSIFGSCSQNFRLKVPL